MMTSDQVQAIVRALVAQATQSLAARRAIDAARPVGTRGISIDFYDSTDRKRPAVDYDVTTPDGRRYQGFGARWAAVLVSWTGTEWRRVRRLSGPLQFEDALDRAGEEAKLRDLPRVD